MEKKKYKNSRSAIDGYYIHDARKAAKFCFEELLICVKLNERNRCYDIYLREKLKVDEKIITIDKVMLTKFLSFYPKSFHIKRYRCLTDTSRTRDEKLNDALMYLSCGLWNFHLKAA